MNQAIIARQWSSKNANRIIPPIHPVKKIYQMDSKIKDMILHDQEEGKKVINHP